MDMDSFISMAFEQYPDEMATILTSNEIFSCPEDLERRLASFRGTSNEILANDTSNEMTFEDACTLDKLHDDYLSAKERLSALPTEIPADTAKILRLGKFADPQERDGALRTQALIRQCADLLARRPKTIDDYRSWLAVADTLH